MHRFLSMESFRCCHYCQIANCSFHRLIISAFFVFCLLLVSAHQQCIRSCSTAFRHSLSAILGIPLTHSQVTSSPLPFVVALSPLDMLIRHSPNNVVVQRKTEWICNSIDKFKQCAENCEENRLKLLQMANVDHWAILCRTLFDQPKIFSEFISCQRKLLSDVGRRCRPPNATTDSGEKPKMIGHFCSQMNAYAKCYRRTAQKCTKNATMISRRLSEAIRQSFVRIHQISRGHLLIPAQCHHSVEILASPTDEKEGDEKVPNSSEEDEGRGDDYWTEEGENGRQLERQKVKMGRNNGKGNELGKKESSRAILISFCIIYYMFFV
ncbi:hypothetical protein niasHT_018313 [Heterodera trifolii]|uniref:Uncharacterized protein n=1 Tax=Heterodera trifolii TaxID=157864 RepID=A0ABD2LFR6_9BILA